MQNVICIYCLACQNTENRKAGGGELNFKRRPNKEVRHARYTVSARICKRLRSPGIDSEESIPPVYVASWRAGTTNRVVAPARQAGNRFLGSLKGLQIRALTV